MSPISERRPWSEQRAAEQQRHPEVYTAYEAFKQAVRDGHDPDDDRPMILIERGGDIPLFTSEAKEHEFWGTHESSDELWRRLPRVADDRLPPVRSRA